MYKVLYGDLGKVLVMAGSRFLLASLAHTFKLLINIDQACVIANHWLDNSNHNIRGVYIYSFQI